MQIYTQLRIVQRKKQIIFSFANIFMINDRIQELIDSISHGNKRAFSMLIGVNPTVIENIVGTRKGKPGYDLLEKIALSIENINIEWLFTGKGKILKTDAEESFPMIAAEPQSEYKCSEESILFKMYREKDEENKALLKEIGRLEERLARLQGTTSSKSTQPGK